MIANIYDVIEDGKKYPALNTFYSAFMLVCIVLSLVPLLSHEETEVFYLIDKATVSVFILDYILRFITAQCKFDRGFLSFVLYPFSFLAIVDILSILPSLNIINKAFKAARIFRLAKLTKIFRTLKAVRVFKFARYSKSADIIRKVLIDSKETLLLLSALAIGYVFTVALIVYNVEPQTFKSFFEALYWATVSLTTVGYGDVTTSSMIGRLITMVSSFVGVAIVALPSGIITAGFMKEISDDE